MCYTGILLCAFKNLILSLPCYLFYLTVFMNFAYFRSIFPYFISIMNCSLQPFASFKRVKKRIYAPCFLLLLFYFISNYSCMANCQKLYMFVFICVAHRNYIRNKCCFLKNEVLYLERGLKCLCNRMKFSFTGIVQS